MEEDRISELPDEILQHILSFIDIYEVVETTILSKRWKYLWRSLPSLRFHLSRATSHRRVTLTDAKDTKAFSFRFSRFVSHFLSRRDATAPVHDFHLSLVGTIQTTTVPPPFVEECVLYAINLGVQSLRLHAPTRLSQRLPAALFTSTTLRELELRQKYTTIFVPGRLSLPNLKTLYLETTLIFDDDHRTEPFANLPELENLSLRGFPINGLVLKAPKLRVLEIFEYSPLIEEISAPLLTSFRYEGYSPLECSIMNLPMLEQVYVDIHGIRYNRKLLHLQCVRLLHQLGNATTVAFTLDTLKFLEPPYGDSIEQGPPPFPNVKFLKMIKGRHEIRSILKRVLNYLTKRTLNFESLVVYYPNDVDLVDEHNSDDQDSEYFWHL